MCSTSPSLTSGLSVTATLTGRPGALDRSQKFPVLALLSSTGGLDALARVLGPLPADFPAAVIAMQHTDPTHPSELAKILDRRTALSVKPATSGAELVPEVPCRRLEATCCWGAITGCI